ncbi:MAG: hypothetical protein MUE65_03420 [Methanomassiliicoccales archaeon]|nr:hypothetical protein [Methanomassiliicoccales archaeon]
METEPLYQAIFKRKSVRNFKPEGLGAKELEQVMAMAMEAVPLFPDIRTSFKLVGSEDVRGIFKVTAPHYLAIYSEAKEGHMANAGFLLQQMDLYLSSKGLGSCWQGGPKPTRGMREHEGMQFVIMLAFGLADEPVHRGSMSEFKREPLGKMTAVHGREDLLDAARLAPSGMNNQPWYFTAADGCVDVHASKSVVVANMNQISAGIALCHLRLAGLHQGQRVDLVCDEGRAKSAPKGYVYVASARFAA